MSEVPLSRERPAVLQSPRLDPARRPGFGGVLVYRGSSLKRKRTPRGPYRRPMLRVLKRSFRGSRGTGVFLWARYSCMVYGRGLRVSQGCTDFCGKGTTETHIAARERAGGIGSERVSEKEGGRERDKKQGVKECVRESDFKRE